MSENNYADHTLEKVLEIIENPSNILAHDLNGVKLAEVNYYKAMFLAKTNNVPEDFGAIAHSDVLYDIAQKAFFKSAKIRYLNEATYYLLGSTKRYLPNDNSSK